MVSGRLGKQVVSRLISTVTGILIGVMIVISYKSTKQRVNFASALPETQGLVLLTVYLKGLKGLRFWALLKESSFLLAYLSTPSTTSWHMAGVHGQ